MATVALAVTSPSIVDVAKRTTPNGEIIPVVEALAQSNALIGSMHWREGNTDTGHMVGRRTGLPSVSWVRANEGVAPSKSISDTFTEGTGMLEGLSSVDKRLVGVNGNFAAYRSSEDDAFLAQMSNTLESAFFYESTTANPERVLGLTPRFASTTTKLAGKQIVLADGSAAGSDQSSMWFIAWGERTVYGISPRGKGTGLQMDDKGEQRTLDANNKVIYKYETLFHWDCGICVEDYRALVRIANIDTSNLSATSQLIITAMIKAVHQLPSDLIGPVKPAFYCNRLVATFLHLQALNFTSNSTLSVDPAPNNGSPGVFGKPIVRCLGFPIYTTDALLSNEAAVS